MKTAKNGKRYFCLVDYRLLGISNKSKTNIAFDGHEQYEIFSICTIHNCAILATFPVSDGQLYVHVNNLISIMATP